MHDLLEGAIPYELKFLLQHAFDAKYLTLSQYNDRVKAFDYGYTELLDKPDKFYTTAANILLEACANT